MSIKLCSFTLNAFQTECFPERACRYKGNGINVTLSLSELRSFVLVQWEQVVGGCFDGLRSSSPPSPSSILICVSSNCVPCTAFQ